MKTFTEEVIERKSIEQGVELQARPSIERTTLALKRVLAMHPSMLKKEKEWTMESEQKNELSPKLKEGLSLNTGSFLRLAITPFR
ncbi:hypothetical protein [Fodinibius sediminis]|uniref:Uncharacterized protein n=1 Tax=Fodinibius sediminis TaxID=1214077 RepID=A0A521F182_9BACT|nr:hypothetical protein [Fodinibius sediminis]SMO89929.1 hypothetical protein SAMN06265218_12128 [Fodinibius sediminis]